MTSGRKYVASAILVKESREGPLPVQYVLLLKRSRTVSEHRGRWQPVEQKIEIPSSDEIEALVKERFGERARVTPEREEQILVEHARRILPSVITAKVDLGRQSGFSIQYPFHIWTRTTKSGKFQRMAFLAYPPTGKEPTIKGDHVDIKWVPDHELKDIQEKNLLVPGAYDAITAALREHIIHDVHMTPVVFEDAPRSEHSFATDFYNAAAVWVPGRGYFFGVKDAGGSKEHAEKRAIDAALNAVHHPRELRKAVIYTGEAPCIRRDPPHDPKGCSELIHEFGIPNIIVAKIDWHSQQRDFGMRHLVEKGHNVLLLSQRGLHAIKMRELNRGYVARKEAERRSHRRGLV